MFSATRSNFTMAMTTIVQQIPIIIYIASFIVLNGITFLLASFYRKNVQRRTLRVGFLTAILLMLFLIGSFFVSAIDDEPMRMIRMLLLFTGSAVSAWNSVALFLTMKKIHR